MSKQMVDRLNRIFVNKTEEILARAIQDEDLMRALLTGPTESASKQMQAARTLQRELLGSGVHGARTIGIGVTQEREE